MKEESEKVGLGLNIQKTKIMAERQNLVLGIMNTLMFSKLKMLRKD